MKAKTQLKSKLSRKFAYTFPTAYQKFTMRHMHDNEGVPEARIQKPLKTCTVALISTAGVHLKTDAPFDVDNPAGDPSYRIVPGSTKESKLTVTHLYYDTKYAKSDPSIVFPLTQLRELAAAGEIGAVADANIGLNGGILDTKAVEERAIPAVVELFQNETIDVALLVPG